MTSLDMMKLCNTEHSYCHENRKNLSDNCHSAPADVRKQNLVNIFSVTVHNRPPRRL